MNKQEAEKKLDKKRNEQTKVFCPLIRADCVMNCVCLMDKIVITENNGEKEYFPFVYCDNSMFTGV